MCSYSKFIFSQNLYSSSEHFVVNFHNNLTKKKLTVHFVRAKVKWSVKHCWWKEFTMTAHWNPLAKWLVFLSSSQKKNSNSNSCLFFHLFALGIFWLLGPKWIVLLFLSLPIHHSNSSFWFFFYQFFTIFIFNYYRRKIMERKYCMEGIIYIKGSGFLEILFAFGIPGSVCFASVSILPVFVFLFSYPAFLLEQNFFFWFRNEKLFLTGTTFFRWFPTFITWL